VAGVRIDDPTLRERAEGFAVLEVRLDATDRELRALGEAFARDMDGAERAAVRAAEGLAAVKEGLREVAAARADLAAAWAELRELEAIKRRRAEE
jgi:hypothetical protein